MPACHHICQGVLRVVTSVGEQNELQQIEIFGPYGPRSQDQGRLGKKTASTVKERGKPPDVPNPCAAGSVFFLMQRYMYYTVRNTSMKTYEYRRVRRRYEGYRNCNQTTQRTLEKQQNTSKSFGSPVLTGSAAAFTKPTNR